MPKRREKPKPSETIAESVRRHLRAAREVRGLSGRALAEQMTSYGAPMSRSAIANFEGGLRDDLSATELVIAALVLRVPLLYFIVGTDEEAPRHTLRLGEREPELQADRLASMLAKPPGATIGGRLATLDEIWDLLKALGEERKEP